MRSVDPFPINQVTMRPEEKKELSDSFESLSPAYKKKLQYVLNNHPWLKNLHH
jgi:hypothetical protein